MDLAHLHFLVAQADPLQRRVLVDMLGQMGAPRVTEVPDGHTALRCFQDSFTPTVNIAIIDLALPGMDGLELIRTLAGMHCQARLIIVGNQPANLMFAVETMAQAYGFDLLGTLTTPRRRCACASCSTTMPCRRCRIPRKARRAAPPSVFPRWESACRRASSNPSFSPRSNWKRARSRAWKPLPAGAIRSTACWVRTPSSARWNSTAASIFSTGA